MAERSGLCFARECLAIRVGRSLPSLKVIDTLEALAKERGLPESITVDNGPEYTSKLIQEWAEKNSVYFDYITPGRPMENGYVESFNGKFREECLDQNWFQGLADASEIIEAWRVDYNTERPHSALGYMSPKEFLKQARSCSHVHDEVANMQTAKGSAMHKFTSTLRTYEQPRPKGRKLNRKNLAKV